MARKGKTKGYYLPQRLIDWLAAQAAAEGRSVSNYLATLVGREMRRGGAEAKGEP